MKNKWTLEELEEEWALLPDERKFLDTQASRADHTGLGFALLFKYFQRAGRFPRTKEELPIVVVAHLASSLGLFGGTEGVGPRGDYRRGGRRRAQRHGFAGTGGGSGRPDDR